MSPQDMFRFFQLSALRIANLALDGSRSLGTYRTLVRQYAEKFGIRGEIETADDPMLAALDLLWQEGYLLLDKWVEGTGWTDRSRYKDINQFVGIGRIRLQLTSKGHALLATMESQVLAAAAPAKSRAIGFHASL